MGEIFPEAIVAPEVFVSQHPSPSKWETSFCGPEPRTKTEMRRTEASGEMMIYCLLNSNHRLTGPVPGRALPAVQGVLIWDAPIDVPRLKQVNWLVNCVVWEILLIWNLLYRIWKK